MVNQFFINFAYMGAFFLTPLMLQRVLEYSTAKTGFVSIVRPLVFAIAGPLAGKAATKVGERVNGVAGGLCLLGSMLLFATVGDGTNEVIVFAALALSGAGMGMTAPAMSAVIANSVDEEDLGVAGGAQQMISQLGVVVGTQIMFTVQQALLGEWGNADTSLVPDEVWAFTYDRGYLVGAVAALLAIAAAVFVRSTTKSGRLTGHENTDVPPVDEPSAELAHAT
jgi:MFS family permease